MYVVVSTEVHTIMTPVYRLHVGKELFGL